MSAEKELEGRLPYSCSDSTTNGSTAYRADRAKARSSQSTKSTTDAAKKADPSGVSYFPPIYSSSNPINLHLRQLADRRQREIRCLEMHVPRLDRRHYRVHIGFLNGVSLLTLGP